jgi:hypothetical protein
VGDLLCIEEDLRSQRKIARPAEMGIGRRSSVGRRRPAVQRKLARPCKDGLQWEICGQEDQQVQDCIGLRGKVQK